MEKPRDELGAAVGSDVFRNSMLREYMCHEQDGKIFGSAMDCRRNEDCLLGETVDYHENWKRLEGFQ